MDYGPMFFNSNLFTINKRPMKFYLDGYSNQEVNYIATIIEALGGKLTMPDETTTVFSEAGRPVTTNYPRYHIQCLHDSIVSMKLQDLEKYRMPLVKQESIDITPDSSPSLNPVDKPTESTYTTSLINLNFTNPLLKPWKIVSVSTYASTDRRNSVESTDQTSESDGNSWLSSSDSDHSEYDNNLRPKEKRPLSVYSDRSHFSCIKRKRDDSDPSDLSNETDSSTQKKRRLIRRVRWSDEENRLVVQYLIDNNAISKAKTLPIFKQMESDRILTDPYRTAYSILGHFNQKLRFNISDYTDNVSALREFKNLNRHTRK